MLSSGSAAECSHQPSIQGMSTIAVFCLFKLESRTRFVQGYGLHNAGLVALWDPGCTSFLAGARRTRCSAVSF